MFCQKQNFLKYPNINACYCLPYHAICVCWNEAILSLTLITPPSALLKSRVFFLWAVTTDASPDKAPIVSAQLSVKGASPCPPLSCWANGYASALAAALFTCRPHCSHMQQGSVPASPHNPTSALPAKSNTPTSCYLFMYLFTLCMLELDIEVSVSGGSGVS